MEAEIELKIYKQLAEIRIRIINMIMHKCRNKVDYPELSKENPLELYGYIADSKRWDYCGILNESDRIILETLENLLKK